MQKISRKLKPSRFWRVFGAPAAIALLSVAGLLSALIGDDIFDVASWLALGLPVALMGWYAGRRGN